MPENAIQCFFGHLQRGDKMKKKTLFFEDEKFVQLVLEIRGNYSNATNTIRWRMEQLLEENGYKMSDFLYWNGKYGIAEREQSVKMPVESVRIVSKGRKPISEEKVSAIREMYLKGFSEREIARVLKVGKGTVGKYLNPES